MIFGKSAAVAGAVTVGILWPFASGQVAQVFYERELSQFSSPYIALDTVSYQRGYLSAEVVTEVRFKGELLKAREANQQPTRFLLNTKLNHGFLSVRGSSTLADNSALGLPLESAKFSINFVGNGTADVQFGAFQSMPCS